MISLPFSIVILVGLMSLVDSLSTIQVIDGYYTENNKLVQEFRASDGTMLDCLIYGDPSIAEEVLAEIPTERRHLVNDETFRKAVDDCNKFQLQGERVTRSKRSLLKGIYPGTNWCGKGNIAGEDNSVGSLLEEDTCCRTHDTCLPKIRVGETKYGLTNDGSFTAFHCQKCDRQFYNCLKRVNSAHSNLIGFTFFDVIGVRCFEDDYPLVCSGWWVFSSCKRDTNRPKVYQFKDFPESYYI